jgi:hypothetical protein
MEGKFQTSFIPKKPVTPATSSLSGGISFLSLIAVILFVASLALASAVFLYQNYLSSSIANKKESFKTNQKAFDPNTVTTYSTLNKRINIAGSLIKKHISVSSLFKVLEDSTLQTIRFNDFNYSYVSDKRINLSMKGQALNYNAIAKQSDVFSQNPASKYIHNPIFSDLDLDSRGNVIFSFTGEVDPEQILYSNNLPETAPVTTETQQTTLEIPEGSTGSGDEPFSDTQ